MKKKKRLMLFAVLMTGSVLFSSCIGSFPLWHKVLNWNNNIDDKWTNELVFLVLHIIPVYPAVGIIDIVVLHSIEFWTGEKPLSDFGAKMIEGKDGLYTVEKKAEGYAIRKEGDERVVEFIFDREDKSWSVKTTGESYKLLRYSEDNASLIICLPGGQEMNVERSAGGYFALRDFLDRPM
jgi:hypothetical protein